MIYSFNSIVKRVLHYGKLGMLDEIIKLKKMTDDENIIFPDTKSVITTIAYNGHIHILEWWKKNSLFMNIDINKVISNGNLDVIKWLVSKDLLQMHWSKVRTWKTKEDKTNLYDIDLSKSAEYGHLNVIQYFILDLKLYNLMGYEYRYNDHNDRSDLIYQLTNCLINSTKRNKYYIFDWIKNYFGIVFTSPRLLDSEISLQYTPEQIDFILQHNRNRHELRLKINSFVQLETLKYLDQNFSSKIKLHLYIGELSSEDMSLLLKTIPNSRSYINESSLRRGNYYNSVPELASEEYNDNSNSNSNDNDYSITSEKKYDIVAELRKWRDEFINEDLYSLNKFVHTLSRVDLRGKDSEHEVELMEIIKSLVLHEKCDDFNLVFEDGHIDIKILRYLVSLGFDTNRIIFMGYHDVKTTYVPSYLWNKNFEDFVFLVENGFWKLTVKTVYDIIIKINCLEPWTNGLIFVQRMYPIEFDKIIVHCLLLLLKDYLKYQISNYFYGEDYEIQIYDKLIWFKDNFSHLFTIEKTEYCKTGADMVNMFFEKNYPFKYLKTKSYIIGHRGIITDNDNYDCSICTDDRIATGDVYTKLKCNHVFHYSCLEQSYNYTKFNSDIDNMAALSTIKCPYCRQETNIVKLGIHPIYSYLQSFES
jgi:hypothetical protein